MYIPRHDVKLDQHKLFLYTFANNVHDLIDLYNTTYI